MAYDWFSYATRFRYIAKVSYNIIFCTITNKHILQLRKEDANMLYKY